MFLCPGLQLLGSPKCPMSDHLRALRVGHAHSAGRAGETCCSGHAHFVWRAEETRRVGHNMSLFKVYLRCIEPEGGKPSALYKNPGTISLFDKTIRFRSN